MSDVLERGGMYKGMPTYLDRQPGYFGLGLMARWAWAVVMILLVACNRAPAPLACVPGATVACACPGSMQGAQTCNAEGSGLGACQCPTDPPLMPGPTPLPAPVAAPVAAPVLAADQPPAAPAAVRPAAQRPVAARAPAARPCGGWTAPCCPGAVCNDPFECSNGMCSVPDVHPAAPVDACAHHRSCTVCAVGEACAWCPGSRQCRERGGGSSCPGQWVTSPGACFGE